MTVSKIYFRKFFELHWENVNLKFYALRYSQQGQIITFNSKLIIMLST